MTLPQVLLDRTHKLIADVFRGSTSSPGHVWVCVRSEDQAGDASWLGCWSSEEASPTEESVKSFLSSLADFSRERFTTGPRGPVLTDHYFKSGWQTWGPGIPGPLSESASQPAPNSPSPIGIQDFRID